MKEDISRITYTGCCNDFICITPLPAKMAGIEGG